jgi:DNA repair protein RadC
MTNEHELEVVNVRLVREPSLYSEEPLDSPGAVAKLMAEELSMYDREVVCVLNMKPNGQCINMNIASMGAVNHVAISPREIFKSAILANATHIILVHNHPSGSVEPSKEDMIMTKQLEECGRLLGITVQDHVIIGGGTREIYSFLAHEQMNGQIDAPNCVREPERTAPNLAVR